MSELSLSVSRKINAAPASVFNAWLDPEMLAAFMLPGEGTSVPSAKTQAKEGGRFDIVMRAGDQDLPHGGIYKEITPHSKIVFTWESPFSVDGSTVTLEFSPDGRGTDVTLTHVKFPTEESRDNHKGGWGNILAALDAALS